MDDISRRTRVLFLRGKLASLRNEYARLKKSEESFRRFNFKASAEHLAARAARTSEDLAAVARELGELEGGAT